MTPDSTRLHTALYSVGLVLLNQCEVPGGHEVRLYRTVAGSHNQWVATGRGWNGNSAIADVFRQVPVPLEARLALAALGAGLLLGALNR